MVIAQYGRLRHLVDYFKDRAGHLVAIGGMNAPLASPNDPRWGRMGRPAIVREEDRVLLDAPDSTNKLGYKIAETARGLFDARDAGAFKATYIVYPVLYGPRQPGSPEWHVVRRIKDGRRSIILPEGGLRLESRAFVRNVAQAPLLALDHPEISDSKTYVVSDRNLYTTCQRVEHIAQYMGADIEIVDMPFELATPAHPLYRHGASHRAGLGDKIRTELGYTDTYETADALETTVQWLLDNPDAYSEIEKQLGDSFDYVFEDQLIHWWRNAVSGAPVPPDGSYSYSHIYRHPKTVGEDWARKS
ncbi:NAD-dependent epimerase/dehydratase family protein [Rhodococcus opacus]|uniref:NAD-dependent epimerase/dehydratase family protein n=1 Tax=Rhodococcus opacus TaxID=37919 RepID=UPI002475CE26|nr:hypothetical protein [Rhodococcus opacus]